MLVIVRLLLFLLLAGTLVSLNIQVVTAADNQIDQAALLHDSRDPLYRSPGGAVMTGTPIRMRFRAADGDLTRARVRVYNDRLNTETFYDMTRVAVNVPDPNSNAVYEFWEVTLPASPDPTVYWYRFVLEDGSARVYYEDHANRRGGAGMVYNQSEDRSWQLTHYASDFTTPAWVKNAVIYQIFPDRFRDGVPGAKTAENGDLPGQHLPAGTFFYNETPTYYRSSPDNNGDWNTRICDPREAQNTRCAGVYSQNFYGGDLQGIIDKLDYLEMLGVTALYLNPIFESPSNHKYDTTDFFHIDDNFGDLQTFQTLTQEADNRGIHIILDGVFNHSSSDSIYFDRYSRWDTQGNPNVGVNDDSGACESLNSPFIDWYPFKAWDPPANDPDAPSPCSDNRDYNYWFGIFDSLPVMNHDNAEVRDYFINQGTDSVGPYWMQWADGWRLDVAPEVDHGQINDPDDDYWEAFRTAVHAQNPETYIVGEEWGNATSWTIGGEWDATMNYQYSAAILSLFRDSRYVDNDFNDGSSAGPLDPIAPSQFVERIQNLEEIYAPEAYQAMMNLFGSHDTNRVLFMLDHGQHNNTTAFYEDPNYDWSDAIARLRGAALVQMTLPGAPTIYYGDEIGLVGPTSWDGSQWQDDPYNRLPYPWLDETGTPFYSHLQDSNQRDALYNYYAMLTGIRHSNPALRTGSFEPVLMADQLGLLAYVRRLPDDSNVAVVVVNNTENAQNATVNLTGIVPHNSALNDEISAGTVNVDANGDVMVNVPANGGVILTTNFAGARPTEVNDLIATPGNGQITLNWTGGAASYDVYRSRLSGGGFEWLATVTDERSYVDDTASNGVTYYYHVVARSAEGLESAPSNEISEQAQLPAPGWHALQWPPTIAYTLDATQPTETIYAQIYVANGTDASDEPAVGIEAQVGFAELGIDPTVNPEQWHWVDMTPNPGYDFSQNNDEYQGAFFPTEVGTYQYTVRWSVDGGASWVYSQLDGPDYNADNVGEMTVSASNDVTAPEAPTNLAVTGSTISSITLTWDQHPNTDGDLYGFNIYRKDNTANETDFTQVDQVIGAAKDGYVDETVTTDSNYTYQITALDNAYNESAPSNTADGDAIRRDVNVTFRVTVPPGTPGPVHIAGSFGQYGLPEWNPGASEMSLTQVDATTWEITLTLPDGGSVDYKYARGAWEQVEKGPAPDYVELGNRQITASYGDDGTMLVEDTVEAWRDPFVTAFTPPDKATDVANDVALTTTWAKNMPETPDGFRLEGPNGFVPVSFSYDANLRQHTLTPLLPLVGGTYTASWNDAVDAVGERQQVPTQWTFDVAVSADTTPPAPPADLAGSVVSVTEVELTWTQHPDIDQDLFGFTVNRRLSGDGAFTLIDVINDPSLTTYRDDQAQPGTEYDYVVTAVDVNGNESGPSNTVTITTPAEQVAVTFKATVPRFTPAAATLYVVGDFSNFGYPAWDPGAQEMAMTANNDGTHSLTLMLPQGATGIQWKITRGSWETVEKAADGYAEVNAPTNNRVLDVVNDATTQDVNVTVENWRDPIVVAFSPPETPIEGNNNDADNASAFDKALAALSAEIGQTLSPQDLESWQSRDEVFNDSSLGCPVPGENYLMVLTPGYIFLLDYAGQTYDVRVEAGPNGYARVCHAQGPFAPVTNLISADSVITIQWNKSMGGTDISNNLSVLDPNDNPVSGQLSYDDSTFTHTFTPDSNFMAGTYGVGVSGAQANNGDTQQVDTAWAFEALDTIDTTPPPAPTSLTATRNGTDKVELNWDAPANPDGDLYVYQVLRRANDTQPFAEVGDFIDAIGAEAATSFTDMSVQPNQGYDYVVRALDFNLNPSADSNVATVDAPSDDVVVTVNVTVPAHTPDDATIRLAGNFDAFNNSPFPGWDPTSDVLELTRVNDTAYSITLTLPSGAEFEYKVTRGSWETVEKLADGNTDIPGDVNGNRLLTVTDSGDGTATETITVENWRDPYVIHVDPSADGVVATGSINVVVTWNQAMPETPGGTFSLLGPSGAVTGSIIYDGTTNTHTFMPDNPLAEGLYTLGVSGNNDVAGDAQIVDWMSSFNVGVPDGMVLVTVDVDVPAHTPDDAKITLAGNFDAFNNSPYPGWDPTSDVLALTRVNDTRYSIDLLLPDGASFEYKVTRGSWDTVEKQADGNADIPGDVNGNRLLSVTDSGDGTQGELISVANWRDPYVIAVLPTDEVNDINPDAVVSVTWNQDMPSSPNGTFTLTGPNGPVSGSFGYDNITFTHTFTPDSALAEGTYALDISGNADANSEGTQQVPFMRSFTVKAPPTPVNVTLNVTVPAHTPDDATIRLAGNFDAFNNSPFPGWDPTSDVLELTRVNDTTYSITLTFPSGAEFEYKVTRGSWETVEKLADGNTDIPGDVNGNRLLTVTDSGDGTATETITVENWRDPYVIAFSPASGTPGLDVTVTWNQAMDANQPQEASFSVTTNNGSVGGALSYDAATNTHTFTPDVALEALEHTVNVTGFRDAGGDSQQVPTTYTFNVVTVDESVDFDDNGLITPSDVVYVVNRIGASATDFPEADVNEDGVIDVADAELVIQQLGLETTQP